MAWSSPRTWVAAETLTAALLNTELRDNLLAAHPTGSFGIFTQAATTVETTIGGSSGWLECNGVAVSRTTYATLNSLLSGLSYPFGSGNGSTTFTLPDLRGRVLVMAGGTGAHADVNGLGDSDGLALGSRTPKDTINISISGTTSSESSHTHSFSDTSSGPDTTGTAASGGGVVVTGSHTHDVSGTTGAGSSHSHTFSDTDSDTVAGNYLVAAVYGIKV